MPIWYANMECQYCLSVQILWTVIISKEPELFVFACSLE